MYGRALLEAGRTADAIEEFESLVSHHSEWQLYNGVYPVVAHYLLGTAYEQLHKPDMAATQYERFLEIWKDADPGLKDVEDARERLANLKGGA